MHRDTVTRCRGPFIMPFIRRHHLMFQHDNAQPHVARICTQFLKAENVPVLPRPAILTRHFTHWSMFGMLWIDVYDSVFQSPRIYTATLHSNWREMGKHSTGHNQQPDQLEGDVNELCCAAWRKWCSHQSLTGFLIHIPTFLLLLVFVTNRCISVFPAMWNP